ncbi:hypothetical protein C7S18_13990 [Ahniella affigens]|uniref:Metallo-beta-lactamase domain-containing protein n=1 Tax=Ahniella affigens TaxID=2021234 RepID=A0A2P1PTS1_9GAMM|nr:hypothetical protein [Ahniella affigens]AVP98235.1 hypothetical protein C7S18_13990 [Ahniella affigens]
MDYEVITRFHGVGQGLFVSGEILALPEDRHDREDGSRRSFSWVYDCGTSSGQQLLQERILEYWGTRPSKILSAGCGCSTVGDLFGRFGSRRDGGKSNIINLLMISHFDQDHISGIVALVKGRRVDLLVLPYLHTFEKLTLLAILGEGDQSEVARFIEDPATYLRQTADADVGQVLYVLGQDDDDREPLDGERFGLRRGWEPPANRDALDPDFEAANRPWGANANQAKYLRSGTGIKLGRLWQFAPYNDSRLQARAQPSFTRQAKTLADDFQRRKTANEKKSVLRDLKDLYDATFGASAIARNIISLFVLGETNSIKHNEWQMLLTAIEETSRFRRLQCMPHIHPEQQPSAFSLLLCGDGYLNNIDRIQALESALGADRLQSLTLFQVMHHGARSNWCPELVQHITPEYALFSSDPNHMGLGHPHPEVVRSFWDRSCQRIDKSRSVQFLVEGHL